MEKGLKYWRGVDKGGLCKGVFFLLHWLHLPSREKPGCNQFKHLQREVNDDVFAQPGLCHGLQQGQESPELPAALPGVGRCRTPTHGWAQPLSH